MSNVKKLTVKELQQLNSLIHRAAMNMQICVYNEKPRCNKQESMIDFANMTPYSGGRGKYISVFINMTVKTKKDFGIFCEEHGN